MAVGQRKQKFGRDVKISLDLTRKELKRFDHSRMMLSRSDFLSILLAWFEETTTGRSTGDQDSILVMNKTGNEYWFIRKPEGFKLTKIKDSEVTMSYKPTRNKNKYREFGHLLEEGQKFCDTSKCLNIVVHSQSFCTHCENERKRQKS
jgi:hypothetical protein